MNGATLYRKDKEYARAIAKMVIKATETNNKQKEIIYPIISELISFEIDSYFRNKLERNNERIVEYISTRG